MLVDKKRSVQPVVFDAFGGLRLPPWKMGLHNFESFRDPIAAVRNCYQISIDRRRRTKLQSATPNTLMPIKKPNNASLVSHSLSD
jgi:hypothetical protein